MSCFVQTCDQVITGRQFQYDRALQIIQEEEYLEDTDIDDIKRYDFLEKINNVNLDFNIPEKHQYNNWIPNQSQENYNYNGKYSKYHIGGGYFEPNQDETYDESKILIRHKRCAPPNDPNCYSFDPASILVNCPCTCFNGDPCSGYSSSSEKDAYTITKTSSSNTTEAPFDEAVETVAQAVGAFGAGMIGMAMMMPDLNFQQNGGSPGGSNAAGTIGGGGLPTDGSISTAALSLALVPLGLAAVAVFPPFVRPRTVPAVAVIFSERRDVAGTVKKRDVRRLQHMVKKRSPNPTLELPSFNEIKYVAQKRPKRSLERDLTKAYNKLNQLRLWISKRMYNKLPSNMKRLVKKFGRIEALLHKTLVCLKPRLKRRYGRLVYPNGLTVKAIKDKKENFLDFVKYGDAEDADVQYIEDCFQDMERPRFGWRVKLTTKENEPCDVNFENPALSTCNLPKSGEADENYYAQSRQTGEGFRSAAPVDCRIEYVCSDPPGQAQVVVAQPDADPIATDERGVGENQDPAQPDPVQPPVPDLTEGTPIPGLPTESAVDTDPFVPIPTYVQGKQPSNSIYFKTN